ncbi:MAG: glycosyltransferase 87 family protein [Gemmatimonadaceae bacterium]
MSSNLLVAATICGAWLALEREAHRAALSAVTGTFIKIFPVAALSFALFHARKRVFVAAVLGFAAVYVAAPCS